MSNTLVVASRRDKIAQRWLRGQAVASIAAELSIPLGTVKRDIQQVRADLLANHADELRMAQARCMASIYSVLDELWRRYEALLAQPAAVRDERVLGAYLSDIVRANTVLGKLAGVYTTRLDIEEHSTIDVRVLAQLHAAVAAVLPPDDPDAQLRLAAALDQLTNELDGTPASAVASAVAAVPLLPTPPPSSSGSKQRIHESGTDGLDVPPQALSRTARQPPVPEFEPDDWIDEEE